jgi:hypothetical protein
MDQHNRDRQDTLGVERKLVTHFWDKRVGLTIFSMIAVNSFRMYKELTYPKGGGETQKEFYGNLAEELIDNTLGQVNLRTPRAARTAAATASAINPSDGSPRMGTHAHLTPTKRKRKNSNHALQGNCKECMKKTKYCCSLCKDNPEKSKEQWICPTDKGKMCFSAHLQTVHEHYVC